MSKRRRWSSNDSRPASLIALIVLLILPFSLFDALPSLPIQNFQTHDFLFDPVNFLGLAPSTFLPRYIKLMIIISFVPCLGPTTESRIYMSLFRTPLPRTLLHEM